jgi:hypothetical protein
MGISGGPNMIDDGLILALDAADVFLPVNKNLLTYTNDLSNATWGKIRSQITASATTAPDGSNTAFAMNITDATGLVRLTHPIVSASIASGPYTFSVYVKQNTSTAQLLDLGIYNAPTTQGTEPSYNILGNFAITGSGSGRSVTSVGNGWYRVATTSTISNNSTWNLFFDIEAGTGTKVNGQGIYLWGPQFEYGTVATEYQPVNVTTRIWPNLVNQSNSGSLTNNPTYDPTNGGIIVFDGVNDFVLGSSNLNISGNDTFSICYWARWNGASFSGDYPSGVGNNSTGNTNQGLSTTWNGGRIALDFWVNRFRATVALNVQTWYYVCFTKTAGLIGSTSKLYANGQEYAGAVEGTDTTPNITLSTFVVGRLDASRWFNGNIANIQIYNRALSPSEILQNYNAQKSRFNL